MRVHYGKPLCVLLYRWNGRDRFYGGRAQDVMSRYARLKDRDETSDFKVKIDGVLHDPETIVLHRTLPR